MIYFLIAGVALYGLLTHTNLIRKLMCLSMVDAVIILAFLRAGYVQGDYPPLLYHDPANMVNPLPQALMLTAIVISVCFNALAVVLIVNLHTKTGSIDTGDLL
ncbi:sodium:proton antiporter [Chitinivibrio alkaliphilus]|uniref:Putative monovalent cation/H+ antiporter subunit C n=1 Tax=Chitinivibrio alkaliphilus ACht1 TaxID=1313304 RepID=U7D960_9BACT|nr:sodium:proton antiporter [Chitinivibrio alkaliphilus]ERP30935.1 putative monovalent cation/H+ antiporter subunit C [Chitinivibrio alkaliphilus ACht1]